MQTQEVDEVQKSVKNHNHHNAMHNGSGTFPTSGPFY